MTDIVDTADTDAINPTNSEGVEEQMLDGDSGSESNTKHSTDDVPVTTDDVADGDDVTDGDDDGGNK